MTVIKIVSSRDRSSGHLLCIERRHHAHKPRSRLQSQRFRMLRCWG